MASVDAAERTIAALVAYDGTDYFGYQVQADSPTIQGTLEAALGSFTTATGRITGAGRTDTGVHARGQVIGATVHWPHALDALQRAWNAHLPQTIAIRGILETREGFHPRFSASSRTYRYTVVQYAGRGQASRSPLTARFAHFEPRPLNLAAMQGAAQALTGTHDFATFGLPPQGDNTVRTVLHAGWHEAQGQPTALIEDEDRTLVFTIEATAFLKHMVRKIVGSLLAVGRNQWSIARFQDAVDSADSSKVAAPVPPNGLVFERVTYPSHWGIVFANQN